MSIPPRTGADNVRTFPRRIPYHPSHPAGRDAPGPAGPGAGSTDRPGDPPTLDGIWPLPPVLTVEQAAAMLKVGRSTAYSAIQRGEWPTSVVRVGRSIRVPTAEVLRLLAAEAEDAEQAPPTGAPAGEQTSGPEARR